MTPVNYATNNEDFNIAVIFSQRKLTPVREAKVDEIVVYLRILRRFFNQKIKVENQKT
jgi:hypothetical protein